MELPKHPLLGISILFLSLPALAQEASPAQPWEALRPLSDLALQLDGPIRWVVLLISVAIFVISAMGCMRSKSKRILIISFAFFLFALKALFKVLDIYYSPGNFFSGPASDTADFLIMLSIFVAIFYKRSSKFFDSAG